MVVYGGYTAALLGNLNCLTATGGAGTSYQCNSFIYGNNIGSGVAFQDLRLSASRTYMPVTGISEETAGTDPDHNVTLICGQLQHSQTMVPFGHTFVCTEYDATSASDGCFIVAASSDSPPFGCWDPFPGGTAGNVGTAGNIATAKNGMIVPIWHPQNDGYGHFYIHDFTAGTGSNTVTTTFNGVGGSSCTATFTAGSSDTNITVAAGIAAAIASGSGSGCTGLTGRQITNHTYYDSATQCGVISNCGIGVQITSADPASVTAIGNVTTCSVGGSGSPAIHCGNDSGTQTPPFASNNDAASNLTQQTPIGATCNYYKLAGAPVSMHGFFCLVPLLGAVGTYQGVGSQFWAPNTSLLRASKNANGTWTFTDGAGNNSFTASVQTTAANAEVKYLGAGGGGSESCASGVATINEPGAPGGVSHYTLPMPCNGNSVCTPGSCGIPAGMALFSYDYSNAGQLTWDQTSTSHPWSGFEDMTIDAAGNYWIASFCDDSSGKEAICYGEWSSADMHNMALGFVEDTTIAAGNSEPMVSLTTTPAGNLILDVGVSGAGGGWPSCGSNGGTCLVSYKCANPCNGTWTRSLLVNYNSTAGPTIQAWIAGCNGVNVNSGTPLTNMFHHADGYHIMMTSLLGFPTRGNACIAFYDHYIGNL